MTPHKINWKTLSASAVAVGALVVAYSDIVIEAISKAAQDAEKGITLGTIGAVVYAINRKRRRKGFEVRDQRWEANDARREAKLDAVMKAVGAEWSLNENGSTSTEVTNSKPYSKSLMGVGKMKEYLKKLGRTKFQAFLLASVLNIGTLVGMWLGIVDIDAQIEHYMPIIVLVIQTVVSGIYQLVEGGIDKARVKATGVPENQETGDHGPAV